MGFKREDIRDTSPLSLKKLNDTIRFIWLKLFGNIDFADLSKDTQGIINDKVGNTTFTQEIDSINQTMSTKASSTSVDALNSRVATAETNISQNSNAIVLKADKTTTDSLGNRLTTAESNINLQANQIATKVDVNGVKSTITQSASEVQVAFNNITGNVKNNSGKFSILNGALEVKNANNVVTIDGSKRIFQILAYGNGPITVNSGNQYATVTIPHNLGTQPVFMGQIVETDNYVYSIPDLWLTTAPDGYMSATYYINMKADVNNLYVTVSRISSQTGGSTTFYYRYYIYDSSSF